MIPDLVYRKGLISANNDHDDGDSGIGGGGGSDKGGDCDVCGVCRDGSGGGNGRGCEVVVVMVVLVGFMAVVVAHRDGIGSSTVWQPILSLGGGRRHTLGSDIKECSEGRSSCHPVFLLPLSWKAQNLTILCFF